MFTFRHSYIMKSLAFLSLIKVLMQGKDIIRSIKAYSKSEYDIIGLKNQNDRLMLFIQHIPFSKT